MKTNSIDLTKKISQLEYIRTFKVSGRVEEITGVVVSATIDMARIGEICRISTDTGYIAAEIVGFRNGRYLLMPYAYLDGLYPDAEVLPMGSSLKLKCGDNLVGRIFDGLGNPINENMNRQLASYDEIRNVRATPPNPLSRNRIQTALLTGIPAIDSLLTLGTGQRVGVFAGAGTGKSTLIGQIARSSNADVVVINLIGERGREVREFIEDNLGKSGLERSVLVIATSDQPAIIRLKSAYTATTIAEYFRDQGKNVLLIMDSVTRFARALREIGLARGEPPARCGYPPSVFAELPRLLERTGNNNLGSITALYTVLVSGDDLTEPVADEVMSILDGHIILSRELAAENHYPAIDILRSKSRVMSKVATTKHFTLAQEILSNYALYTSNQDAIRFGFYKSGENLELDHAVKIKSKIDDLLCSEPGTFASLISVQNVLTDIVKGT
ncbi:FliI/YscN family ATPase [bacterium]|nr:FliI/YscN family ATPase [bacterium]